VNPVSTPMLWRWMTGGRVVRVFVPIEAMTPTLPATVIASEDARFCTHGGVDWQSLRKVVDDADSLDEARGGSTITQQLAKNLFLWQGRSFIRKGLEFPLALWIDLVLSKRRIMELYLNVAEWGPRGEFGAEAGSRQAFNKSVREIGPREAALMAAVLPNPIRRSARQPGAGVRRLGGIYQARARSADTRCLRRD
jgi:monofunctional biosynthetic peptidoglycan transglycosylase